MYSFALLKNERSEQWSRLLLRLMVGFGFMEHGLAKLSRGPGTFGNILHALGVPSPHFMAWLTILTEIGCGLAVFLGEFVTLAAVPMAAILLVAIFTVHLPYGFSSIKLISANASGVQFGPPGYECDLLYLTCLASLVITGPGFFAMDRISASAIRKVSLKV
jgi:putative oxidoreductase